MKFVGVHGQETKLDSKALLELCGYVDLEYERSVHAGREIVHYSVTRIIDDRSAGHAITGESLNLRPSLRGSSDRYVMNLRAVGRPASFE